MSQPEVTIEQGTLRGRVAKDIKGNKFYKFQGISYAKPPLGDLRFKAPQPPEKWSGIWDATKEGDICYSRNPFKNQEISGSENCLFVNVYTRKLPTSDNQNLSPVLFWIHGGGFVNGSGNEYYYGPEFLITEDVVLVTFNYRLGLLGFVSFADPSLESTGNAGLKDQVMALKWVQKNISNFGGDPNNVTIFGESAGAVAVHLLMLSPMAKGLFHKAIAESGSAVNPKIQETADTKYLATVMSLEGSDEKKIYNVLIAKSVDEVLEIQEKIDALGDPNRLLGYIIEKNSKEPFLDQDPLEMITPGNFSQVPFLIGYNTCEGIYYNLSSGQEKSTPNFEDYIPKYFGYENGTSESKAVAKKIEFFYFGPDGFTQETAQNMQDLLSDYGIVYGEHISIMRQIDISKSSTYLYRMSVETKLNFFKKIMNLNYSGVAHMDDIGYLFKNVTTPTIEPGSIEDLSMQRFVRLWTNFAKFGNPTPEEIDSLLGTTWKPVTGLNFDFLDIGKVLVPLINPDVKRMNFWDELYAESPNGTKNK